LAEGVVAGRGKIDIVVAGVGGFAGGSLLETDVETWRRMLDLNLTSAFSVAKAVVPAMVRARYGRVVMVASRAVVPPAGGFIAYTVAKAAVIALTQAPAQETRPNGGRVNAVRPSTTDTPADRAAMAASHRTKRSASAWGGETRRRSTSSCRAIRSERTVWPGPFSETPRMRAISRRKPSSGCTRPPEAFAASRSSRHGSIGSWSTCAWTTS